MGLDLEIYAIGPKPTEKQLNNANEYLIDRLLRGDWDDYYQDDNSDRPGKPLRWFDSYNSLGPRLQFMTLNRYYGPGYERGFWPRHYNILMCMRQAIPSNMCIYYGNDADQTGTAISSKFMDGMWKYWLSDNGVNYNKSTRQLNEYLQNMYTPE